MVKEGFCLLVLFHYRDDIHRHLADNISHGSFTFFPIDLSEGKTWFTRIIWFTRTDMSCCASLPSWTSWFMMWTIENILFTARRLYCRHIEWCDSFLGLISVLFCSLYFLLDHCEMLSGCPDDEPMTPGEEGLDAAVDDSLLETSPIQSPLQVFAGMGGLALIAERLPMLYPDVIQQVSISLKNTQNIYPVLCIRPYSTAVLLFGDSFCFISYAFILWPRAQHFRCFLCTLSLIARIILHRSAHP